MCASLQKEVGNIGMGRLMCKFRKGRYRAEQPFLNYNAISFLFCILCLVLRAPHQ